jgi:D-alanyl-D-alanine carboxypeptidase
MDPTRIEHRVTRIFEKMVAADPSIKNAHLLVHSDSLQVHLNLAGGNAGSDENDPVIVGQPVYMASVGKLFTATLIAMLCERCSLSFQCQIGDILDAKLLAGLHVYEGNDYSNRIQVRHLLNHTSGLPDYFEDKPVTGRRMVERIINEPGREYLPGEIVTWTKGNLNPKFPPGKGFHYSDTGYLILGLVVEAVTGMPFHDALQQLIFKPLGMKQAYLIGRSNPLETCRFPVAGIYFGDKNVASYPSLSMDYAGGGITAPLEDLQFFMRALAEGKLINISTFRRINEYARFVPGIDYGYGLMEIRPVPLLMPAKYSSWGNAGSTGAFMFYHPGLDTTLIGSLNRFRYHQKGIRLMFHIIDAMLKEKI